MNIAQIENSLQQFVKSFKQGAFIYNLLLAFGTPKATVKRLQKGGLNLSKIEGELAWKKKLFFKSVRGEDLHQLIEVIKKNERALKHAPRFIIVTDNENILAVDTKTNEGLDIPILDLPKHFDFFLPLAGMEKHQATNENPADVKAAGKMAKLFDEIKKENPTHTAAEVHNLNVFLSRLLFCFFAEDTGIFNDTQFTNAIANHTQEDGSDLNAYLDRLFVVLNTDYPKRKNLPEYLNAFPYVNGGLFNRPHHAPVFNRKSKATIIECGSLQWKDIHPDIFGSMFQAVIKPEERGEKGMHYTSVPNIMKVIKPLFLDELSEELEAGKNEPKRLLSLLDRIGKIKIFDPACGSGNFLIIAYKELRALEIKILQQLKELQRAVSGFEPKQLELIPKAQLTLASQFQLEMFSRIELSNFYGIELDDFAHEIAILSLWLAQHQMNMKFKEVLGTANPTLPLRAGGNIIQGNATRLNWERVCPKNNNEVYILGNPPYLGYSLQTKQQKEDLAFVFKGIDGYKNLDYIACWFYKGGLYIQNHSAQLALVSTNSICQGEQVGSLWPHILNLDLEIGFAHTSFKWENNAKGQAAVICVIVGIRNVNNSAKYLFRDKFKAKVGNINPYLVDGASIFIEKRGKPLSILQPIIRGSGFSDNGHLQLTSDEKEKILASDISIAPFIKKVVGSFELINKVERWCIWIDDNDFSKAKAIPEIKKRIEAVKAFRLKSKKETTLQSAQLAYKASEARFNPNSSIVIPRVSSVRRKYIPIDFVNPDTVVIDSAQAIYNPMAWSFAVVNSRMHVVWVAAVAGRLKTDYRYSSALCYNTFPFPEINQTQKTELERNVVSVLAEREKHSEQTLAQMYDPDKMPQGLKEAHHELDLAVERCYRSKPFDSDEERLAYLFKLYEQMIESEKSRGTLFEVAPKSKRKKKAHA